MILDGYLVLMGSVSAASLALSGQACNGAGTIVSTNSVDNGPLPLNQAGDQGAGEAVEVSFAILSAPTVGTSVAFLLVEADDAALTVNVNVIVQTAAFPIANLPVGTIVPVHLDHAAPFPARRYWGAQVVNVGAIATLSVFAGVLKNLQDVKTLVFKSGYGIA